LIEFKCHRERRGQRRKVASKGEFVKGEEGRYKKKLMPTNQNSGVWRRPAHTRRFQIKDGTNLRSIEKYRERAERIRLRRLSETVWPPFDTKPVVC
jgi:hypothetical protein